MLAPRTLRSLAAVGMGPVPSPSISVNSLGLSFPASWALFRARYSHPPLPTNALGRLRPAPHRPDNANVSYHLHHPRLSRKMNFAFVSMPSENSRTLASPCSTTSSTVLTLMATPPMHLRLSVSSALSSSHTWQRVEPPAFSSSPKAGVRGSSPNGPRLCDFFHHQYSCLVQFTLPTTHTYLHSNT